MATKKKNGNLKLVEAADTENEGKRWEKVEKDLLITPAEAKHRVKLLREELEAYRDQLEAVPFDIPSGDMAPPICLDSIVGRERKYTLELLNDLDTKGKAMFDMIDKYAKEHGCDEGSLDFNAKLFELKMGAAESAFKMGVLAGVIFAGCPKEQVDRYERGMVFSLMADSRLVKGADRGN